MLQRGDSLGPYELIDKIGKGAFAEVWRAKEHEGFGPELAIKILKNDNTTNTNNTNKEIFQREADIWVKLGFHPNVMPIIRADIYDDYYVITSFYTSEGSLESWLKNNNGRAPSEKVAIELTLGILEGLAHLHNNKIIHSDLAPKNILLQRGIPQLIDFGISKIFTSTRSTVDGSSGTPIYMAPEVYNGETSRRSDIWSVGVIFYQLLCGQLPFEGKNYFELLKKISDAPITPLPPTVSKPIQDIIYRALEKDRKNRFQSAEEMIEALKAASLSNSALPPPANPFPPLKNAMDYVVRAIENYKQGNFDQALADFNLAIKFDPKYATAYNGRALVYKNQGKFDQALADLNEVIELDPKEAYAYYFRGDVYKNQGKLDQALADYTKVIELDPREAYAYNNRGDVYKNQGKLDQALADYTKAIELDPKYANAYYFRGSVYKNQGKFDQALANFNQAIQLDPKNAAFYITRGNVYSDQGKLDQALADYNKAIKLNPKDAYAYNNRGTFYKNQNKLDLALTDFNQAIQVDPKSVDAYNHRGLVYYDQGKLNQALADFNKAIELDPKYANAYYFRGNVYYDQGKFDQALADFNKAIELDPKDAHAYYIRGLLHKKRNNKAEAIADLQKAKSLYQDPQWIQKTIDQLRSLGVEE
jgi:tetratricopeptide (TPR) repeat protein